MGVLLLVNFALRVGVTFNLLKSTSACAPTGLTFKNFTFCHTKFVCFVFISEQTATFVPYNVN